MFKSLMLTSLLSTGLGAFSSQPFNPYTKNVSYDDESREIVLSADEMNNYTWNNVLSYLSNVNTGMNIFGTLSYDTYENKNITIDNNHNLYSFLVASTTRIGLMQNGDKQFHFYGLGDEPNSDTFEYSTTFIINNIYYSDFKSAIELDIQANSPSPSQPYRNAFAEFISILVAGVVSLATGVAGGVVAMAKALFLKTSEGAVVGLSVFGGMVAIFAGLALAIALTTKVYTWVTSLGN